MNSPYDSDTPVFRNSDSNAPNNTLMIGFSKKEDADLSYPASEVLTDAYARSSGNSTPPRNNVTPASSIWSKTKTSSEPIAPPEYIPVQTGSITIKDKAQLSVGTKQTPAIIPNNQQHMHLHTKRKISAAHESFSNADMPGCDVPKILFHDLVRKTVSANENAVFAKWYNISGKCTDKYTFGELWEEAGIISYHLRNKWDCDKGDRAILCYNVGLNFFASFLGCLRAGVVAVPVYPPGIPLVKSLTKMNKTVSDCKPKLILTDSDVNLLRKLDNMKPHSKSRHLWPNDIEFKDTNKLRGNGLKSYFMSRKKKKTISFDDETISISDLAFLQYTSGSTGDPKGVMVTVGALSANVNMIHFAAHKEHSRSGLLPGEIVGVSWLPQYHDMGLIYAVIAPFSGGWKTHLMSPIDFMKRPSLWIELMSQNKATWSVAPDFGYRYVARKFFNGRNRAGGRIGMTNVDLSSILYLQNAAEPIRSDTKRIFSDIFSEYGLCDSWFRTGYGLAENVVACCYKRGYTLATTEHASTVAVGSRQSFVPNLLIKIVSPQTAEELVDGETGEIWISGPSVAAGYFGRPELSEEVFRAKMKGSDRAFLRTGDLGFFEDDHLFVTGRIKDLIIQNGVNYYPQDIEHVVQDASPLVRPGCVAAFSSNDTGNDGDLIVVFEIRKEGAYEAANVINNAKKSIVQNIGLTPTRMVAIKERTIPKTTSGKIQRRATRSNLQEDKLEVVNEESDTRASSISASENFFNDSEPHTSFEAIVGSFIGRNFDPEQTWDDLGLSSMAAVEMRDVLDESYAVMLEPDCFERYPTPAALKEYIDNNKGTRFQVQLPELFLLKSQGISWSTMSAIQALGVISLLFLFTLPIIPAYYVGALASTWASTTIYVSGRSIRWMWLPFAVPTWMFCFSLSVVMAKWIIVGRYSECEMRIPSIAYVRWWWVDNAISLWESWVGKFVVETPLIWLFYVLMGANIHPSAQLDGFLREFDLLDIAEEASIKHRVCCRQFGSWEEDGPSLHFRRISISKGSTIHGMVCPGATIGEEAFIEKLSVVAEGAKVPDGVLAAGNPAFNAGTVSKSHNLCWWKLGALKVAWIFVELYIFFGGLFVAQVLLNNRLPHRWRYTPLLYWFFLIGLSSVFSIGTSIVLKWVLIGCRQPGPFEDRVWRRAADWAADYHYHNALSILFSICCESRVWNVVLMLHGMDIDLSTRITPALYVPSKIDLIHHSNSFVSIVNFDTKKDGEYHSIYISDSSVGAHGHIEPNVRLSGVIVPPLTLVKDSIEKEAVPEETSHPPGWCEHALLTEFFYAVLIGGLFLSLIPSFEIWKSTNPTTAEEAVPVIAFATAAQTISWMVFFWFIQFAVYGRSPKGQTVPRNRRLFQANLSFCWPLQAWSFLPTLLGSPLFNVVLKFLGATIEGHILVLRPRLFDFPLLIFSGRTVVDGAILTAHYVVYDKVTIGPCHISGLLHEGAFGMANSETVGVESAPYRLIPQNNSIDNSVSEPEQSGLATPLLDASVAET